MRALEEQLIRLAARQHGVFTRAQVVALGFTERQIDYMLGTGRLVALHPGTYRLAAAGLGAHQGAVAACLACGRGAVVSHRSAASIWGLDIPTSAPEITVPEHRHPDVPGIVVYRARYLRRGNVATREGIPLTTPARTLIDLAAMLPEDKLEDALDDAVRRGLVNLDGVMSALSRPENAHKRGTGTLRRLVAIRDRSRGIGSHLETRLFRILRRARLPLPRPQHRVQMARRVRYIDFAYVDEKIAIEVDGYESHTSRRQFDDDRLRRNELRELGWEVVQITWTMIHKLPDEVVNAVARALRLVPARWRRAT